MKLKSIVGGAGRHLLLTFILSMTNFGLASAAPVYSEIFVFGDTLSETGNYVATGFNFPPPPYATGRFSNGPVWVEHLAGSLGLDVSASVAGGNNYSWGGAKTGGQPGPLPPFDLDVQKNAFLLGHGGVADADALYVVWGGGNDALGGDVSNSASNLGAIINDLAGAGAMHFLVVNLPEIGPLFAQFNDDLDGVLDNLDNTLAIDLTRYDVNAVYGLVLSDALLNAGGIYGVTNVSDPCFDGVNVCADPDSYLYWDTIHPTAAAHQILGDFAFQTLTAVPLPAGVWLLTSALVTITVARRRRA